MMTVATKQIRGNKINILSDEKYCIYYQVLINEIKDETVDVM